LSEDYLVVSDPDVCGGKPVVRGTRVPVQYILELWDRGYSVERIHEEYQSVPKELIEKVIKALEANRVIKLVH
jgi:uncharacterized protein (DUF433 family)